LSPVNPVAHGTSELLFILLALIIVYCAGCGQL